MNICLYKHRALPFDRNSDIIERLSRHGCGALSNPISDRGCFCCPDGDVFMKYHLFLALLLFGLIVGCQSHSGPTLPSQPQQNLETSSAPSGITQSVDRHLWGYYHCEINLISACLGSTTTRDHSPARVIVGACVAFLRVTGSASRFTFFEAQCPAHWYLSLRFDGSLATASARLEARRFATPFL